jgi:hypothetical protein
MIAGIGAGFTRFNTGLEFLMSHRLFPSGTRMKDKPARERLALSVRYPTDDGYVASTFLAAVPPRS